MGIEKYIDMFLKGKKKSPKFEEPVDLVAVRALALYADKKRINESDVNFKVGCLTDNELAAFVELKSKYPYYERAIRHMADCSQCRSRAFNLSRLLHAEEGDSPIDLVYNAFADARLITSQMKRPPRRRLISLLSAAATIVIVLSGLLYQFFKPESGVVYITFLAGNVELIRSEKTVSPAVKLMLSDGDIIRTGANSFVFLQIDESIVIKIAENSNVTMNSIFSRKNRELLINRGKVLSNVVKLAKDNAYEVRTPMIIASVLGTEFSVKYSPGTSVIAVSRSVGGVSVVAGKKETVVPQGISMTFTEKEKSRVISDSELLELENISKIPIIKGIETKTEVEIRDIIAPFMYKKSVLITTLEQMKAKYGRIDTVILYNGRVIEGVILSRGVNYTILTTKGNIILPERQIRATQVR